MSELPRVDPTRCTGCGDCVVACPADCLEMAGAVVWLPRPARCVSCEVCVLVCPAKAIEMVADDGVRR